MLKNRFGVACGVLLAVTGNSAGATYPARPMTMVIPFAAGGPPMCSVASWRTVWARILGQQVVVENVGGAGGMTGSKRVADAAPDGYTFVLGTVGTHAQSQTMYKKPLYNAATDFTPVALSPRSRSCSLRARTCGGERSQGIHRLRQGQPEPHAIRPQPARARRLISAACCSTTSSAST